MNNGCLLPRLLLLLLVAVDLLPDTASQHLSSLLSASLPVSLPFKEHLPVSDHGILGSDLQNFFGSKSFGDNFYALGHLDTNSSFIESELLAKLVEFDLSFEVIELDIIGLQPSSVDNPAFAILNCILDIHLLLEFTE